MYKYIHVLCVCMIVCFLNKLTCATQKFARIGIIYQHLKLWRPLLDTLGKKQFFAQCILILAKIIKKCVSLERNIFQVRTMKNEPVCFVFLT